MTEWVGDCARSLLRSQVLNPLENVARELQRTQLFGGGQAVSLIVGLMPLFNQRDGDPKEVR